MWLRKARGGSGVGEYWWPADGSVTEVPDQLAAGLLAIPDGGYTKADGPDPEPEKPKPAAAKAAPAPAAPAAKTAGKDAS